jgi:phage tail sheath protein FI
MNDDGTSNYWVNVLNEKSKYVYAIGSAVGSNWGNTAYNTAFTDGGNTSFTNALVGGADGRPTDGDIQNAYDLFKPVDSITVSLLMTGGHSQGVSEYVIQNIAEVRKDCVAFVSPLMADVVDNSGHEATDIVSYRNDFNASSYAVMDSAWKKQYDKYNNVDSWVPLNGDIAGLCARTDYTNDAWFSPAGLNRGLIKNVVKLSWNPQQAERDTLYSNSVNPVVTFKGTGTVLYGDKTLTNKPSAFDRINVRRLFIVLETTISKAAKYSLFEFNDDFTRSQFVSLVEPFLRDVKGRRGIYDYKVVCDNTNNTPQVIDSNQFVGDIYIKPARSINFIQLNFIAVGTGVDFTQVIGKF